MSTRIRWLTLSGIVLTAFILRFMAALDAPWLDEVATYYLAMSIEEPMEAITRIRLDHHILNTAFMRLVGDTPNWLLYRLLSLVTGFLLIPFMYRAGANVDSKGNLLAPLLACVSFPLITYSSEARGYAPAIFFSIASLIILRLGWIRRLLIYRLIFWLLTVSALLAHITSIYILAGMTAWSAYRIWQTYMKYPAGLKDELTDFLITFAPPYAALFSIYFLIMRHCTSVGGDILPLHRVLTETLACFAGFPLHYPWAIAGALFTALLLTVSALHSLRTDTGLGIFYVTSILIAPALTLIAYDKDYLFVRYFILCFPFAILMVTDLLIHLLKDPANRRIAVLIIATYCLGQTLHITRFLNTGRGGYLQAVEEITSGTSQQPVIVSGDHDFRVGMMTVYYSRFLKESNNLRYIPAPSLPASGADWYITHQIDSQIPPPALLLGEWLYTLTSTYPYYGLSGMTWNLYKRSGLYSGKSL